MKALVVYGSKRGGTEGLAQMVGQALAEQGIDVTVQSAAARAPDVGSYDGVVVGGAPVRESLAQGRQAVRTSAGQGTAGHEGLAVQQRPAW